MECGHGRKREDSRKEANYVTLMLAMYDSHRLLLQLLTTNRLQMLNKPTYYLR